MAAVLLAGVLVAVGGCKTPRVDKPLTATLAKDDIETQMEFWHRLGEQPMTSNDDAFHGLLLYLDGKDASANYDERVSALKSRNLLLKGFNRPGDEALRRGTLAVPLLKITQAQGGVMLAMLGPTPRYAVRELQYMGLYPPSSPNQTFSGSEFVGIIGRIEDFQRGNPADKPAAELPGDDSSK